MKSNEADPLPQSDEEDDDDVASGYAPIVEAGKKRDAESKNSKEKSPMFAIRRSSKSDAPQRARTPPATRSDGPPPQARPFSRTLSIRHKSAGAEATRAKTPPATRRDETPLQARQFKLTRVHELWLERAGTEARENCRTNSGDELAQAAAEAEARVCVTALPDRPVARGTWA